MTNCVRLCNRKISKKYHFHFKKKQGVDPLVCKICQKELDVKNEKNKKRACDKTKSKYFKAHNIQITPNIGILEKVQ